MIQYLSNIFILVTTICCCFCFTRTIECFIPTVYISTCSTDRGIQTARTTKTASALVPETVSLLIGGRITNRLQRKVASHGDSDNIDDATTSTEVLQVIQNPALQKIYPKLLQYKEQFGHPNIPLPEGKPLETIRRLHIQNKLASSDIEVLRNINFRFHSLEDVYDYANFDEMFNKLLEYREIYGTVSPPKKYPNDPELGAWVTGIRRLGTHKMKIPEHVDILNSVNFEWTTSTSTRQCGSTFMKQYRSIVAKVEEAKEQQKQQSSTDLQDKYSDSIVVDTIVQNDETIQKWVRAIQSNSNNLSETRQHYMESLFGNDWKERTFL